MLLLYGKQKPLPYSSSFDKGLYNIFGDVGEYEKDTFFHNANGVIKEEFGKIPFDEKPPIEE